MASPVMRLFALCLALVLVSLVSALPRRKRQTYVYNPCQQPNGIFPDSTDCSRYYECYNNEATLSECAYGLYFNPGMGICDWPWNVPSCPTSSGSQNLKADSVNLCSMNPYGGNPAEAFQVRHPQYCNAFYTCGIGYVFGQCVFCPEQTFFNTTVGVCSPLPLGLSDYNSVCQGTQYIAHADKVMRTISAECWPFADIPNPWQDLYNSLLG